MTHPFPLALRAASARTSQTSRQSPGGKDVEAANAAKGLGWFSIGLGAAQLLAPRRLGRTIGVGNHPVLMRAMGVREIATGVGVLSQRRPKLGLWARVAGDALDFALLARALRRRRRRRGRIASAAGMVLAVGVMDYLCAREV